ncbi:MAG TPA: sigma-70 family RNA polymerase sigma factor [Actinomycetes bacterium]|jgi:RNA polymerase sigma factor (sigma-70 family)|nr:sigma-70 family RNA polymerase sigma factor [Actinomycetes bacterium]
MGETDPVQRFDSHQEHPGGRGRPGEREPPGRAARPGPTAADAAELVARVAAGDEAAWHEVVERYGGLVWAVARALRLSTDEAADVSQIAWLRLLEHAATLRAPEKLGAWLATTVRRESLRVLRARRRDIPVGGDSAWERAGPEGVPSDTALLRAERDASLWRAFESLPTHYQPLVRLLLADPPLTYAEISAALDMPVGSIGPTRARCLAHLRRSLSGWDVA